MNLGWTIGNPEKKFVALIILSRSRHS